MAIIHSFTNSEVFMALYGYSHGLMVIVMIMTSYFLASQIRLFYTFYDMLDEIRVKLEEISILYDHQFVKQNPILDSNTIQQKLTFDFVKKFNDRIFDQIIDIVNKYRDDINSRTQRMFKQDQNDLSVEQALQQQPQLASCKTSKDTTTTNNNNDNMNKIITTHSLQTVKRKEKELQPQTDMCTIEFEHLIIPPHVGNTKAERQGTQVTQHPDLEEVESNSATVMGSTPAGVSDAENDTECKTKITVLKPASLHIVRQGLSSAATPLTSPFTGSRDEMIMQTINSNDHDQDHNHTSKNSQHNTCPHNHNTTHNNNNNNNNNDNIGGSSKCNPVSEMPLRTSRAAAISVSTPSQSATEILGTADLMHCDLDDKKKNKDQIEHDLEYVQDKVDQARNWLKITSNRSSGNSVFALKQNYSKAAAGQSVVVFGKKNDTLIKKCCNCMMIISRFISILFDLKSLVWAVASHLFDTVTDFGLIYEWGILYKMQQDDENFLGGKKTVDIGALFFCSLFVVIYYRIGSAFQVYRLNHSFSDAIYQFLFDFFIIKLVYINLVKMHSYKPLEMVKIMRGIEGSHESAYQAILSLVFLIKTNFGDIEQQSIIAIISLIFSLLSLISRFIAFDYYYLIPNARSKFKCGKIIHFLFRSVEVVFSVLLFSLFWTQVGGLYVGILIALSLYVPYKIYKTKGYLSTEFLKVFLISDIASPTMLNDYNLQKTVYGYMKPACKKWCRIFFDIEKLFVFRLVICGIIICTTYGSLDTTGSINHDIINNLILAQIGMPFLLLGLKWLIVKKYVIHDAWTLSDKEGELVFNPLNFMSRNKTNEMLFCKYMRVASVFDIDKNNTTQGYCAIKSKKISEIADNVLEALILADDINCYDIVERWYNKVHPHRKHETDNFETYLTKKVGWNEERMMKQLRKFCTKPDSFILVGKKLGLIDFSHAIVEKAYGSNLLHTMCYRARLNVVKWMFREHMVTNENISAVDKNNNTALHCVILGILNLNKRRFEECSYEEKTIFDILINNGINESIKCQPDKNMYGNIKKEVTAKELVKEVTGTAELYDKLRKRGLK